MEYHLFFALWLGLIIFTTWFVLSEHKLYAYEEMGHWLRYMRIGSLLYTHPDQAITLYVRVLRELVWNYTPVMPMAFFYPIIGLKRLPYILAVANLIVIPVTLSFIPLQRLFLQKEGLYGELQTRFGRTLLLWPVFFCLTYSKFMLPAIRGVGDMGGVLLINIALFLALKNLDDRKILRLLPIPFLLIAAVFTRRWFSIWIPGFFIGYIAQASYVAYLRKNYREFIQTLKDLTFIATAFFALLAIISPPFFLQLLGIKSVDADEAWQIATPTWANIIRRYVSYHGYFHICMFVGGLATMLSSKNLRRYGILIAMNFAVSFVLFTRIQDFSTFHHYLLMPYIIICSSFLTTKALSMLKGRHIAQATLSAVIMIVTLCNFLFIFVPAFSWLQPVINPIAPAYKTYPVARMDIPELLRLNKTLYELTSKDNSKIMFLPNSQVINHFGMFAMHYSLNDALPLTKYLVEPDFADRRDGFASNLFTVDYVVTALPIQLNLKPKDQQILVLPSEMIEGRKFIGRAFTKLEYEFTLEKNVKLYIYKRTSKFRQSDIDELSNKLKRIYPDHPFVFTPQIPSEYID